MTNELRTINTVTFVSKSYLTTNMATFVSKSYLSKSTNEWHVYWNLEGLSYSIGKELYKKEAYMQIIMVGN